MFKQWTDADNIVIDMMYAKEFILKCEDKYGVDAVEDVLDACHALQRFGVDKRKRPKQISRKVELERRKALAEHEESTYNALWETLPDDGIPQYEERPLTNTSGNA